MTTSLKEKITIKVETLKDISKLDAALELGKKLIIEKLGYNE